MDEVLQDGGADGCAMDNGNVETWCCAGTWDECCGWQEGTPNSAVMQSILGATVRVDRE